MPSDHTPDGNFADLRASGTLERHDESLRAGSAGAVAGGFLLTATSATDQSGLLILGLVVAVTAVLAPLIRFSDADESAVITDQVAAV